MEPKDLADHLSLSTSNVYMILRGDQKLAVEHGKKVAVLFNISLDDLYGDLEELPIYLRLRPGESRETAEKEIRKIIEERRMNHYQEGKEEK
jgi:hypothetical protein